ncbi:hypothetical protein, partial [Pseudomonas putida]|uniref:hypothetical protein n=1 Tax=Pseudomonas putida TaxID=303 RepID=UPI001C0D4EA9
MDDIGIPDLALSRGKPAPICSALFSDASPYRWLLACQREGRGSPLARADFRTGPSVVFQK